MTPREVLTYTNLHYRCTAVPPATRTHAFSVSVGAAERWSHLRRNILYVETSHILNCSEFLPHGPRSEHYANHVDQSLRELNKLGTLTAASSLAFIMRQSPAAAEKYLTWASPTQRARLFLEKTGNKAVLRGELPVAAVYRNFVSSLTELDIPLLEAWLRAAVREN